MPERRHKKPQLKASKLVKFSFSSSSTNFSPSATFSQYQCKTKLERSFQLRIDWLSQRTSAQASTFLCGAEHHLLVEIKLFNTQLFGRLPYQPLMTDNDVLTYQSLLEKKRFRLRNEGKNTGVKLMLSLCSQTCIWCYFSSLSSIL